MSILLRLRVKEKIQIIYKYMQKLNVEEEIALLRATLKQLSAKRYKRFNVLLKNEVYEKLEGRAKLDGTSKAKCLSKMIGVYQ